jgi:hypothetical protein
MKPLRSCTLVLAYLCFHTFDAKAQWTQINAGLTNTYVNALAVSGTNLFAGTESGVFRSTDSGTSWIAASAGLTNTQVQALAVSGTNLFAGTSVGVFLSTDNGTSWTTANTGVKNFDVISLAVSGTNLFAGTWGSGVFLSTNNGTSWIAASAGLANPYIRAIAVSGTSLFAGTDGGVFLSTNDGTSWTEVSTGLTNTYVSALTVFGTSLFAGTERGGVFLSTNNGTSWTAASAGLTNAYVHAIAVSGTSLFAGTDGGVFVAATFGGSWSAVNTGLAYADVRALAVSGTNLFAGIRSVGVWRRPFSDWTSLFIPTNGMGGITSPATFIWKSDQKATAYVCQLSTTPGFENFVLNQNLADTTYTVSNLQLGTVYYWRVRAENTTWASEWGYGQFTTKLTSPPQLLSPTTGAMLASATPTLSWTQAVSTATYTVQLSTRSAFDAGVYSKGTSSASVTVPQLEGSTLYYWRVRAQTVGDTTAWSDVGFFRTLPNAPSAITLIYPDSSKQDAFQNDWLLWQPNATSSSYTVELSTSPLFSVIFDSATTSGTGYRSPNKQFTAGMTYFWRVRGSNWGGNGQFSLVWSFRAGNDFRKAVALYSLQAINFGSAKVGQFKDTVVTIANNGNDSLKINSIVPSDSAISVGPTSGTISPGKSLFIETLRFAPTSGGNVNTIIVLNSNALTSPDSIKVSGFGLSYGLRLSTVKIDVGRVLPGKSKDTTVTIANTGSDSLKITGISTSAPGITMRPTSCCIPPGGFVMDTIHFADAILGSVSVSIIITSNAPSSPDSIQIISSGVTATEVTKELGIPREFSLSQNYPNPFNPSTNIRFSVAQAGHVSLKVYNVLGVEVTSLVNEQKEAGTFSVTWNAAGLSSGVYLYQMAVTSEQGRLFNDVRRLVLLK